MSADGSRHPEKAQPAQQSVSPTPKPSVMTVEAPSLTYRTWVDHTGQSRAVAAILGVEGDIVRVRKENGRLAAVPIERLSEDDVQYVRQWLEQQKNQRTSE